MLKTYSQSDIEQLGVCILKLRHKHESVKCRFIVVSGDGPAEYTKNNV